MNKRTWSLGLGLLLATAGAQNNTTPGPVKAGPSGAASSTTAPSRCLKLERLDWQVAGGTIPPELSFVSGVILQTIGTQRCLTEDLLKRILQNANNALLQRGYITTRVSVPEQDASQGTLRLTLVPGRVEQILVEGGLLQAQLLPLRPGQLLNVRDLDQSVENLSRARSVQAKTRIEPGQQQGYSVVRILTAPAAASNAAAAEQRKISGDVGLSALPFSKPENIQVQGGVQIDNLSGRADTLRLSGQVNPGAFSGGSGAAGVNLGYSFPFKRTLLSLGGGYNKSNFQTAGLNAPLNFGTSGWNLSAQVQWTPQREAFKRTDLNLGVRFADTSNSLNGTNIEVQRARSFGADASLRHSDQVGGLRYNVSVGDRLMYRYNPIRSGMQAISNTVYGEYDLIWNLTRQLSWQSGAQGQVGMLAPEAQPFVIGGGSLRGSGALQFAGDHGVAVRNALSYALPLPSPHALSAFLAADYGYVSGSKLLDTPQQHVVGTAVGVQGQYQGLRYQAMVGYPFYPRSKVYKSSVNFGVSMQYYF